jgi:hypothetical protein
VLDQCWWEAAEVAGEETRTCRHELSVTGSPVPWPQPDRSKGTAGLSRHPQP